MIRELDVSNLNHDSAPQKRFLFFLELLDGFEPSPSVWKTDILPIKLKKHIARTVAVKNSPVSLSTHGR